MLHSIRDYTKNSEQVGNGAVRSLCWWHAAKKRVQNWTACRLTWLSVQLCSCSDVFARTERNCITSEKLACMWPELTGLVVLNNYCEEVLHELASKCDLKSVDKNWREFLVRNHPLNHCIFNGNYSWLDVWHAISQQLCEIEGWF